MALPTLSFSRPLGLAALAKGAWRALLWAGLAGLLCAAALPVLPARAQEDLEAQAMRAALALAEEEDWEGALQAAPAGIGREIIAWQRLRAGEGFLDEYEAFLADHKDWPLMYVVRASGEAAAARSTIPGRVIGYFGSRSPRSAQGAIALVKALRATGQDAQAEKIAERAWVRLSFLPEEEAELTALAGPVLARSHSQRFERLLRSGPLDEAERMLSHLAPDLAALGRARLALQRDRSTGINALISAVPPALADDPGLAYDRFAWRMRRDLYDSALPLIFERSRSAEALGNPATWAPRRAFLTRWLAAQGRADEAYALAVQHHLSRGGAYAELEFLAGFVALRHLHDPARALSHFHKLENAVSTPISLSRAYYWQGRAYEAAGEAELARLAYEQAARHQTAYYGLLAAERLGLSLDRALLEDIPTPGWEGAAWTRSSLHEAALLLHRAGDLDLAKDFWVQLMAGQDLTGLAQMGEMALSIGQPYIAVLVGKAAARKRVILMRYYYPATDLVPRIGLPVSRAFALAISRRESEFNHMAHSRANARGLMQLIPSTAEKMAGEVNLPYELERLKHDPAYNVRLGTAYLAGLVEEFGTSVALIASAYNAGPSRAHAWMKENGDPRRPDVDVVDWVEMIPFGETRSYVMRVVESLVIYRARLRGWVKPVNILEELKG